MRKILILVLSIVLFGCNNEKEEIINTFNLSTIENGNIKIFISELNDNNFDIYNDSTCLKNNTKEVLFDWINTNL